MDSQPTDKVEGVDFVRGGQDKTPTQKKRNSYERTVVKADTPTVNITEGNEEYGAPWIVESPWGTVTTSAYNDGKKRCLSAEGGSGDPRKKVYEQNKTFTRSFSKGHRLSEDEIRAEAQKRRKEMRGAARAAEMTEEEVALEKLKGLAEKAAARKAARGQAGTVKRAAVEAARKTATGQAGTVKRAAGEATRRASTGQANKDKHAAGEAARKAATGQAGTVKRAAGEATRRASTGQANKDKHAAGEAKRKAATGQAGKVKRAAEEAARWAATGQADKDKHAGVEATRWAKKKPQRLRRSKKRPRSINSEPRTGARPSVRLCVGPELARCVHTTKMR
jgi:hypothetical protein